MYFIYVSNQPEQDVPGAASAIPSPKAAISSATLESLGPSPWTTVTLGEGSSGGAGGPQNLSFAS